MAEMIQQIQFKRGTEENLTRFLVGTNVLAAGEPAYEIDTNKMKIGDGVKGYAELPYFADGSSSIKQLVFDSVYEFPAASKADSKSLYAAKDGATYYFDANVGHYKMLIVDNRQFIGLIVNNANEIVEAERQLDGGNASADYSIENWTV